MPKVYWFNKNEVLSRMRVLESMMKSADKTDCYKIMFVILWLYEVIIQNIMCKYYKFNDSSSHSDENITLTSSMILEILRTQEKETSRRLEVKRLLNSLVVYRTLRNHIAHFSIYMTRMLYYSYLLCKLR